MQPGPEFVGLLQDLFGAKKIKTAGKFPIMSPHPKRTIGEPALVAEAQRIYNPDAPSVPAKGPSAKMQEAGTAPAMDMDANRYVK